MSESKKVRVATRENATELKAEDINGVSGAGSLTSTGRCRDLRRGKKNEILCEDWETD